MITDRFLVEDFLPVCPFVDVTHPGGYCVVHSKIFKQAAPAQSRIDKRLDVWGCGDGGSPSSDLFVIHLSAIFEREKLDSRRNKCGRCLWEYIKSFSLIYPAHITHTHT